jgi:hypothetical protein
MPSNLFANIMKVNRMGKVGNSIRNKHELSGKTKSLDGRYITPDFNNNYEVVRQSENIDNDSVEGESIEDINKLAPKSKNKKQRTSKSPLSLTSSKISCTNQLLKTQKISSQLKLTTSLSKKLIKNSSSISTIPSTLKKPPSKSSK